MEDMWRAPLRFKCSLVSVHRGRLDVCFFPTLICVCLGREEEASTHQMEPSLDWVYLLSTCHKAALNIPLSWWFVRLHLYICLNALYSVCCLDLFRTRQDGRVNEDHKAMQQQVREISICGFRKVLPTASSVHFVCQVHEWMWHWRD